MESTRGFYPWVLKRMNDFGIVGAFIGGWLFSMLGIATPFGGMGGTIFVAFIGAVVLLFILRLIRGSTRKV